MLDPKHRQNGHWHNVLLLYEGIGGSGKAAVLACKKMLIALAVAVFVRFSVLDIDPEAEDELGESFYYEGDVPAHDLIAGLQKRPKDFPGWERLGDPKQLRRAAGASNKLYKGAQTCKPLGQLALLWQLWKQRNQFMNFLMQSIFDLKAPCTDPTNGCFSQNESIGAIKRTTRRKFPVSITQSASPCGGTGAGQLLDMADLRHHLCQQWGLIDYELYLDLLLPEVFNHDDERVKANTWETLQQIMARYDGEYQPSRQIGPITIHRPRPPWAGITLWNRMSANIIYTGREQVVQVMVEVWRMKHLGSMGQTYQGRLVNQASFEYPNIASAAGCDRITIEVDDLITLGGYDLNQWLVDDYLLRQLSQEQAEQQARQQVQAFGQSIGLFNLARRFDRDVNGRPIKADLSRFKDDKRQELPAILADFDHKLFTAIAAALKEKAKVEGKQFVATLTDWVEMILNATEGGVPQARHSLAALDDELARLQSSVGRQIKQARAALAALEAGRSERKWLRGLKLAPRQGYFSHQQNRFEAKMRLLKLTTEQESLARYRQHTQRQLELVVGWIAALEHLSGQLRLKAANFAVERNANRPVCVKNALCPDQEKALIEERMAPARLQAARGLTFDWDGTAYTLFCRGEQEVNTGPKSLWSDEGLAKFLDYARGFFSGLKDLSLEQFLAAHSHQTAEEFLTEMERRAAPLVALNPVEQHPQPRRVTVFASEKGAAGFFKPAAGKADWSVVASGDPHQVELLITWHHLNPLALQQAPEWEEAYHREVAKGSMPAPADRPKYGSEAETGQPDEPNEDQLAVEPAQEGIDVQS